MFQLEEKETPKTEYMIYAACSTVDLIPIPKTDTDTDIDTVTDNDTDTMKMHIKEIYTDTAERIRSHFTQFACCVLLELATIFDTPRWSAFGCYGFERCFSACWCV